MSEHYTETTDRHTIGSPLHHATYDTRHRNDHLSPPLPRPRKPLLTHSPVDRSIADPTAGC